MSHRLIFMKSNTFNSVKNTFDQSSVMFSALELIILRVSCIFYPFEVFINVIPFLQAEYVN